MSVRIFAGRYRLEERLGGGGTSVVWRAYDQVLGRWVAVKLVSRQHRTKSLPRDRLLGEAEAAALLNHPGIAKVHDYGESGGRPFVVMELLEGQTLAHRLRSGPLPTRVALEICAQVAAAVAAAHERGLVHRDIKPANVMLSTAGATLLDFGIATTASQSPDPVGAVWGTPAYIAPERLTRRQVVPASDVYALGLLLYRALTGRLPWTARGTSQMLAAHLSIDPAPLPPETGAPPEIAALCRQCLAKDPGQRPTARQVALALVAALAASPLAVPDYGTVAIHGGSARPRLRHAARRSLRTRPTSWEHVTSLTSWQRSTSWRRSTSWERPTNWAMRTRPARIPAGSWRKRAGRLLGPSVFTVLLAMLSICATGDAAKPPKAALGPADAVAGPTVAIVRLGLALPHLASAVPAPGGVAPVPPHQVQLGLLDWPARSGLPGLLGR